MIQIPQNPALPMTPPAAAMPAMGLPAATTTPAADVISPAEAQFWQEQAARAPALIRAQSPVEIEKMKIAFTPYAVGGIALGAALGITSFTKQIPGKWKWASIPAALVSLGFGAAMMSMRGAVAQTGEAIKLYANALEQNPHLREELAQVLSFKITADKMQKLGLDKAVAQEAMNYAFYSMSHQVGVERGQQLGAACRM